MNNRNYPVFLLIFAEDIKKRGHNKSKVFTELKKYGIKGLQGGIS